jgi:hypothetical protein
MNITGCRLDGTWTHRHWIGVHLTVGVHVKLLRSTPYTTKYGVQFHNSVLSYVPSTYSWYVA